MTSYRIAGLAALGLIVLIKPALAVPAPGPIAGAGLPALAIIGGAYWLGRRLLGRKN